MILRPERCVLGANSAPLRDQERVVFYEQVGWGRGNGLLCVCSGENSGWGGDNGAERGRGAQLGQVWARAQGTGQLVGAPGGQEGTFRRGLQLGGGWTRAEGGKVSGSEALGPLSRAGRGSSCGSDLPGLTAVAVPIPPLWEVGVAALWVHLPAGFWGGGGAWRGPGVMPCARRPGLWAGVWGRGPGKSGSGSLAQGGVF